MRFRKIRPFVFALFAFLVPLAMVGPARADLVLGFPNNDLSGPPGTSGWSTAGDGAVTPIGGGQVTITESSSAFLETDLYLVFTMPTGATSLQFTINSVFADSSVANNEMGGFFPDGFGASLLDPNTLNPLVPPDDPSTDSFYTTDIVQGVNVPLGVVSVSLAGANLDNQSVEILFKLIGGTDPDSTSSVTISNVIVIAGGAVPEPSSIVTGLTAVVIMAGAQGKRARRRAAAKKLGLATQRTSCAG